MELCMQKLRSTFLVNRENYECRCIISALKNRSEIQSNKLNIEFSLLSKLIFGPKKEFITQQHFEPYEL
ncbi:hypothetical protein BpHYR1_013070 [Brachionus plicatilis]|uniref:Uncharacterized protein n=1 Tax=Brachionus plicatilis TaxID=10195 RepID=A0A3M7RU72_BRAPC|nr:hypothetical protein BpHYR1_013070 [Brachionus plicatilis]